jgi:hypothetical protein
MRKFHLTSDKFVGTAELWFGFDGMLVKIDLMHAALNYEQIKYLLHNLSPDIETFRMLPDSIHVQEVPFEITVDDFLHVYPYSRNTHLVREWWPKQIRKKHLLAYFGAIEYRDYCKRNAWYKPRVAITWLQKEEYLNKWKEL